MAMNRWRRLILHFANEHIDFRWPEMCAIARLFSFEIRLANTSNIDVSPYVVVDVSSDRSAQHLMSRSVLLKSVYEYWASAKTTNELYAAISNLPSDFTESFKSSKNSFRIIIEAFHKQYSLPEKIAKIEDFLNNGFTFNGPIDLKNPSWSFHLLEQYELGADEPIEVLFGRWLGDAQREMVPKYDLKKRKFIGNTSMDPYLAAVMANQAHATPGKIAFDPFVGTGGLLIACAHWGSYVIGADMDYQLLHARGKSSRCGVLMRSADESILNNLKQYGLQNQYLDVLVVDSSRHKLWRPDVKFDLIITDPPYGIREPSKKIGSVVKDCTVDEDKRIDHIPSKIFYPLASVYSDLLNFSARHLYLGGKLVFWLPVVLDLYDEDCLPRHPCLKLLHNSEQKFSTKVGRRLVTMEKVVESVDESVLNGGELPKDPFLEASFREQYFGAEIIAKERYGDPNKDPSAPSRKQLRTQRRMVQEQFLEAKSAKLKEEEKPEQLTGTQTA